MPIPNELELELFQSVADFAPVMLWRINAAFKRDWVNRAWLEYTGERLENQIGFGWLDRLHPSEVEQVTEQFDQAFAAREQTSVEFRLRRHDGAYRWFVDSGAPIYRKGEFAGFIGCCIDVHARKLCEERLEIAQTGAASLLAILSRRESTASE